MMEAVMSLVKKPLEAGTKTARSFVRSFVALSSLLLPSLLLSCDGVSWGPVGVSQGELGYIEYVMVDTTVDETQPDTNFSASPTMSVSSGGTSRAYALISWLPLTIAPPSDAVVQSAVLTLQSTSPCSGAMFEARRIPPGWDWDPATATWACRSDLNGSTKSGCDGGQAALQWAPTAVVGIGYCHKSTVTFDLTADMAEWVSTGELGGSINGYLISAVSPFGSTFFYSSDAAAASAPTLLMAWDAAGGIVPVLSTPPPLDRGTPTNTFDATRFIWDLNAPGMPVGSNIQVGVGPNAISPDRAAHLRGHIYEFNAATPATPDDTTNLAGVEISVLGRPELGRTFSRADGLFDLVINGGGTATLVFRKPGYLEAQRIVEVSWGGAESAPDVILQREPTGCTGVLTSGSSTGFFTGNTSCVGGTCTSTGGNAWSVTDTRGTRSVAFYVPPSTNVMQGSTAISQWRLCHDEYTRAVAPGNSGLIVDAAMPADIATNTGYTYASEGQIRQVTGASDPGTVREGARFQNGGVDSPIFMYVRADQFSAGPNDSVDFPVGTAIPYGYYDRSLGSWIPGEDGVVVQVDRTTATCAVQDIAAWAPSTERTGLCALAPAGVVSRFWRVPVRHFTPSDCNAGQEVPNPNPQLIAQGPPESSTCRAGSILHCEGRALGEVMPAIGTGQSLAYHSGNQLGRRDAFRVGVRPVRAGEPLPGLENVRLRLEVAGRILPWQTLGAAQAISSDPNVATVMLEWDGLDGFGRQSLGVASATVRLSYEIRVPFNCPTSSGGGGGGGGGRRLFGSVSAGSGSVVPGCTLRPMWRERELTVQLGTLDARVRGFGGLTLTEHHAYDPQERILYFGDGSRRSYEGNGASIRRLLQPTAPFTAVTAVAVAPDGTVYFGLDNGSVINAQAGDGVYRLNPSAPGGYEAVYTGSSIQWVGALAVSSTRLYVGGRHCVRELQLGAPTATLLRTLGNCTPTLPRPNPPSDGLSAMGGALENTALLDLEALSDLFVHRDGSVYLADNRAVVDDRVLRYVPDATDGQIQYVMRGDVPTTPTTQGVGSIAATPDGFLRSHCFGSVIESIDSQGNVTTPIGSLATGNDIRDGLSGPSYVGFNSDPNQQFESRSGLAEFAGDIYFSNNSFTTGTGGPESGSILRFDRRTRRVYTYVGAPVLGMNASGAMIQPGVPLGSVGATPVGARTVRNVDNSLGRMDFDFRGDGTMYLVAQNNLYAVEPANESGLTTAHTISSEDGSELYEFDAGGRHLRTLDGATRAVRWRYFYDATGRLSSFMDPEGQTSSISYTASQITITAPGPLATTIAINGTGYASSVQEPSGATRTWIFNLGTNGLMTTFSEPDESTNHVFTYEPSTGRLWTDTGLADASGRPVPEATLTTSTITPAPPAPLASIPPTFTNVNLTRSGPGVSEDFRMAVEEGSVVRRQHLRASTTAGSPTIVSESVSRGSDTAYATAADGSASYVRWGIDPRGEFDQARFAAETRVCMPGDTTDCTEAGIASPVACTTGTPPVAGCRLPGGTCCTGAGCACAGALQPLTILTSRFLAGTTLIEQTNIAAISGVFGRTRLTPDTTFGAVQRIDSILSGTGLSATNSTEPASGNITTSTYLDSNGRVRRVQMPNRHPICFDYTGNNQRPDRIYQGAFTTCTYSAAITPQRVSAFTYNPTFRWLTGATDGPTGGAGTSTTTITPNNPTGTPSSVLPPGRTGANPSLSILSYDNDDQPLTVRTPGHAANNAFTYTIRDLPLTADNLALTGALYDAEGRPEQITYATNNIIDPSYQATTGYLTSIATTSVNTFGTTLATWGVTPDALGRPTSIALTSPYAMTHTFNYASGSAITFSPSDTVTLGSTFSAIVRREIARDTGRMNALEVVMGSGTSDPVARMAYTYAPLSVDSSPFHTTTFSRGGTASTATLRLGRAAPVAFVDNEGAHVEGTVSTTGGPTGAPTNYVTTVSANGFGELTSVQTLAGSAAQYSNTICARDAVGRITRRMERLGTDTAILWSYAYDVAGRLTGAQRGLASPVSATTCAGVTAAAWPTTTAEFSYDDANNPTPAATWVTNLANDQLTAIPGGITYAYDGLGHLSTRTAAGQQRNFDYNVLGQLRRVATGPIATASLRYSYEYDGRSRLTAIRDVGTPANTQYFAYANDLEPVAWRRGNTCLFFVYGSQPHVPDLAYEDSNCADTNYGINKVYRYLTDERGSVRRVLDITATTPVVTETLEYDEWGNFLTATRPTAQPFGYAGGIWLPGLGPTEMGLWHFGARDYSPEMRRWTARDPSGFEGGLNLYEYAGSDPINHVDTNGEWFWLIGIPIVILVWGAAAPSDTAAHPASVPGMALGVVLIPAICTIGGGAGAGQSLEAIREEYVRRVSEIVARGNRMRAAGATSEEIARVLVPLRNALKMELRANGPWLVRLFLNLRNWAKYGAAAGPTADYLFRRAQNWDAVVEGVGRTNDVVNGMFGL
jgi:RHS repeat-associated protein